MSKPELIFKREPFRIVKGVTTHVFHNTRVPWLVVERLAGHDELGGERWEKVQFFELGHPEACFIMEMMFDAGRQKEKMLMLPKPIGEREETS